MFKERVLNWLAENGIKPKRVRLINTRRYPNEVRLYLEPQEMPNSRKSFRETHRDESRRYGHTMIFSRKISMYIHINEEDFKSKHERAFILEQCRSELV